MTYFESISDFQKESFEKAHSFFSNSTYTKNFEDIIKHVSSLNAWLEYYIRTNNFPVAVSDFFAEAVNDAILAYYFSRTGTWRPALQSLRSTIENTLLFLYYKDHLIELAQWNNLKHKIGFTDLLSYLKGHPKFYGINPNILGLEAIEKAYAELSRSVHGSSHYLRMVPKAPDAELPSVYIQDGIELSRFTSSVVHLSGGLNKVLVAMFSEALQGASLPALRAGIGATLSKSTRDEIKTSLSINLKNT